MKFLETVQHVIDFARARNEEHVESDGSFDLLTSPKNTHEKRWESKQRNLERHLRSLPLDVVHRLLTVMYLGRDGGNFRELQQYLKRQCSSMDAAVAQIKGKTPLDDYLESGIQECKKQSIALN